MKIKLYLKKLTQLILTLIIVMMISSPSFGQNVTIKLKSMSKQVTMPDGVEIKMWGFFNRAGKVTTWLPGPTLTLNEGDNLTIKLKNFLAEPVSIIIPGQVATFTPETVLDVQGRTRVKSFTHETLQGTVGTYTWNNLKAGTYLYQSGSQPAKQVQMGLYGALTVGTYPDTSGDVTLLYSEIDPALHNPPTGATPLGYHPRYFLVNGKADHPVLDAGNTAQPTVLRFLNAGLDFHTPVLNDGSYMSLVAEDGNPYPFPKEQYSVLLQAGKTKEALWQPATAGNHVIYDRRLNGMYTSLNVTE